jgi:hypothetical protein
MSPWIYEQDLVPQKYRILIAVRHDLIIRQIAADLGIGLQELRRYIIEHFDMILLENLPARYEAALLAAGGTDRADRGMGRDLYTRFIPLIQEDTMNRIYEMVHARITAGTSFDDAVSEGRAMVREAMRV